ncbi:MAG: glycosyltransferase [Microlunatus sp.]|nr:glycosyltransferase [Microlunatus sp.]MDN5770067.1 glycosyltransferase [Microlunatus sp.]
MRNVEIHPTKLGRLASLLSPDRAFQLGQTAERARLLFAGHTMWNINATAQGGGVAELLTGLLAYGRGAGVDTRWLVLDADPEFFSLTKRIHNNIHGVPGDGGPLGSAERRRYEAVLASNLTELTRQVRPGDVVLLHDPQTAGLIEGLRGRGAHVIWRSHIGRDESNDYTERGWEFLRPYVEPADGFIFSRRKFVPDWLSDRTTQIIPPSIDPFSAKNLDLDDARVRAVLVRAGLVANSEPVGDLSFVRRDGTAGLVRKHENLLLDGAPPPPADARLVVQVSRWDRLKDMAGVLRGFTDRLPEMPADTHLMLVGPAVEGVSDDPEGAEVLAECAEMWQQLPDHARDRTHLAALPMDDVDENAHLVNALQRHAYLVVQKSLVEGFGLTVTEAMWKARPVIASAIGGIQDQITDGQDGLLLDDPTDLDQFAHTLIQALTDEDLAAQIGAAARARVQDRFLGDRHLSQYGKLLVALVSADR